MFVRCATCHGSVWLELVETDRELQRACEGCGQRYKLKTRDPEATAALRKRARSFALESGIDLPGALSVLLGLMTFEQVQDVGTAVQRPLIPTATPTDGRAADGPSVTTEAGRAAGPPTVATTFDPAFFPAIETGLLTPRQAIERGDRKCFAQRLIERHKMSEGLALAVADNRMSLLGAIRRQQEYEERQSTIAVRVHGPTEPRSSPRTLARGVTIAVAVAIIVSLGAGWWYLERRPAPPTSSVAVQTDAQGRVTRIEGPDARSVLKAYCAARRTQRPLEPMGLMPTAMEGSRVRIGVLRDPANKDWLLAIAIRRERDASRWAAGDGRSPLIAIRAPDGANATFVKLREMP